jgi:hypothetical protein
MQKIPTLFERNGKLVTERVTPGCEWVLAGEGIATRKWDGTCCMVRGGKLYKRITWDAQKGPAPPEWLHHDFDPAQRSGHGWLPVGPGPEDWMHRLATIPEQDGTYELCGPKIGDNAEHQDGYVLIPHGVHLFEHFDHAPARTFAGLREWLTGKDLEGIVFWHPDGRRAKIKLRDFGLRRPVLQKVKP